MCFTSIKHVLAFPWLLGIMLCHKTEKLNRLANLTECSYIISIVPRLILNYSSRAYSISNYRKNWTKFFTSIAHFWFNPYLHHQLIHPFTNKLFLCCFNSKTHSRLKLVELHHKFSYLPHYTPNDFWIHTKSFRLSRINIAPKSLMMSFLRIL